jgi:hypothetical protein
MQRFRQPLFIQIKRQIGKTAFYRRIPVVDLTRLQQKRIPGMATMALTPAVKLLSTGKGNTDQVAIVPVRIKRMTFKVRFNRFNARV